MYLWALKPLMMFLCVSLKSISNLYTYFRTRHLISFNGSRFTFNEQNSLQFYIPSIPFHSASFRLIPQEISPAKFDNS